MKGVYSSKEFQDLIQGSMFSRDPQKAIIQEFFSGIIEQVNVTENQTIVIKYAIKPALTDMEIRRRKEDERFCQYCFRFEKHDYECKNGGWKI